MIKISGKIILSFAALFFFLISCDSQTENLTRHTDLELSAYVLDFDAQASSRMLTVNRDTLSYSVFTTQQWLSAAKTIDGLVVSVRSNATGKIRNTKLIVSSDGTQKVITVTQKEKLGGGDEPGGGQPGGDFIEPESDILELGASEQLEATIFILSNLDDLQLEFENEKYDWVSHINFSGNYLSVKVTPNYSFSPRVASAIISHPSGASAEIAFIQKGGEFTAEGEWKWTAYNPALSDSNDSGIVSIKFDQNHGSYAVSYLGQQAEEHGVSIFLKKIGQELYYEYGQDLGKSVEYFFLTMDSYNSLQFVPPVREAEPGYRLKAEIIDAGKFMIPGEVYLEQEKYSVFIGVGLRTDGYSEQIDYLKDIVFEKIN